MRLELTTSASLNVPTLDQVELGTAYKYGALTDCATGASLLNVEQADGEITGSYNLGHYFNKILYFAQLYHFSDSV